LRLLYFSNKESDLIKELSYFTIDKNDDFFKLSSADIYIIYDEIFENNDKNIFFLIEKIKEITIKKRPLIIVISNFVDSKYIVSLMRSGVCDFLLSDTLNTDILFQSIQDSFRYLYGKDLIIGKEKDLTVFDDRIRTPRNYNWEQLENNKNYDLTLVMITISFNNEVDGRYSITSKEKIIKDVMDEFSRVSSKFGGILWYWTNDSGMLAFHFDDHVNCGVLASIYIITHFNIFCIEKLRINELINIKISVHSGIGKFNRNDTQNITSDLLNSLVHLQFQYKDSGNFYITSDTYNKLSNRINNYFEKSDFFEGKQIFKLKNKKM